MGLGIIVLLKYHPEIAALFKNVDTKLLTKLQHIHDMCDPSEWKNELKALKELYEPSNLIPGQQISGSTHPKKP